MSDEDFAREEGRRQNENITHFLFSERALPVAYGAVFAGWMMVMEEIDTHTYTQPISNQHALYSTSIPPLDITHHAKMHQAGVGGRPYWSGGSRLQTPDLLMLI